MQLLKIRGKKGEKLWENICGAGYMIKSQRRFLGGSVLIRSLRVICHYESSQKIPDAHMPSGF